LLLVYYFIVIIKKKHTDNLAMIGQSYVQMNSVSVMKTATMDLKEEDMNEDEKELYQFLKSQDLDHFFGLLHANKMTLSVLMTAPVELIDQMMKDDLKMNSFEQIRMKNGLTILQANQEDIQNMGGVQSNTGIQEAEPDNDNNGVGGVGREGLALDDRPCHTVSIPIMLMLGTRYCYRCCLMNVPS